MKLKHAILSIMDRDMMKDVVYDLEKDVNVDLRSREAMEDLLSRSRSATVTLLLEYLGEQEVKQVCELMDIDSSGRRGRLVERLIEEELSGTSNRQDVIPGVNEKRDEAKIAETETAISPEVQPQKVRLPDPPPGMFRISKTELVWPGKYNEDGTLKEVPRVSLPFQVIETINESRATREAQKVGLQGTLFDVYEGKEGDTFEEGWKNKLIWGDNLLVMGALQEKFAGKIDLIYIDPPFATGADFSFKTQIGDGGLEVTKEQSAIEEKAYRDTWGQGIGSYLQMMYQRLALMRSLLSQSGSIYVHCDYRVNSYMRCILDDLFGESNFRNEIYAKRKTKNLQNQFDTVTRLNIALDSVLWYSIDPGIRFRPPQKPAPEANHDQWNNFWNNADRPTLRYPLLGINPTDGQWRWTRDKAEAAVKNYQEYLEQFSKEMSLYEYWQKIGMSKRFIKREPEATRCYYWVEPKEEIAADTDWSDIYAYDNSPNAYATQKSEPFLHRIVAASSKEGDLIADFFCGSGTTLAVAEKLGRRWIGCDLGRWGVHVTRKRMLGIENCKPFEVLNLGKYERQYWQGVTFGDAKDKSLTEQALYEYLSFILKLYGAQPVAGMAHIHGKKNKALIHIGAVDAPVTIAEIDAAVDECAKLRQNELHVLGWEWEMGLYDLMVEAAKKKGVKLLLLQIPREVMEQQAAAKGDVRFFELAYLEAEIRQPRKLAAQVALKDFVIPNTELIPEEIRDKVKKWSDYIDYWAVDWDFRNDTFMQGWVAYRTRKERKLPLTSDSYTYEKQGKYRILVKVIDIFGNDTSQAFDVEVK